MDGDGLSSAHPANLRLLEIGGYPNVLGLRDGEHLLASGHLHANFDRLIPDDPVYGRQKFGVTQVERCLMDLRQRGLGAGLTVYCACALDRNLARLISACFFRALTRLAELGSALIDKF